MRKERSLGIKSSCICFKEPIENSKKIGIRIFLSHKKEWNNAIYSNMDGSRDYHSKLSEVSQTERNKYLMLSLICWIFKKMVQINIYKTYRVTDMGNNLMVVCAQSYQTNCGPMDSSPSGSFVHVIFQASILDQVAIPFSRGSSWPRDQIQVSCIADRFFTIWVTREAQCYSYQG